MPVTEETVIQQIRGSEVLVVIAYELFVHELDVSISLSERLDLRTRGKLDLLLFSVGLNFPVLLLVLVPVEVNLVHHFRSGHENSAALSRLSDGSQCVSSSLSGDGLN